MPTVTFLPMGRTVTAAAGQTLLEAAHEHDIDLEGACEGSLACATCHVVVDRQWFGRLPESSEEEDDLLDGAFDLTEQSRLACQIVLTEAMDGLTVTIPHYSVNMHVDRR
ncbi:MAG: 2Fe-2S iron-sulfur cluster binding domain-containing protein [Magnetococcales bacterium]|nr:2Fe-2S iron-sulfur cluster binding domain-containing protein [Magnetococcales bacterium]